MPRASAVAALLDVGRRSELAAGVAIAAVLALAGIILVAQPRLMGDAESSSLARTVAAAPPQQVGLRLELIDLFLLPGNAPAPEAIATRLAAEAGALPTQLLAPFAAGRNVFDTPRFTVAEVDGGPPQLPTWLTLRHHPDLGDRATYVAGSPPRPVDEQDEDGLAIFEVALSVTTADTVGLTVGSLLTLGVSDDSLLRRVPGPLPAPFVARITGLVELTPPADPYWFGDARLHRPVVNDTNAGAEVFAYATYQPDQLSAAPFVVDGTVRLRAEQRRQLLAEMVDLDTADATLLALRTNATAGTVGGLAVSSGLDQVLVNAADRRLTARATTLLATVGLLGVTLATVVQFLRLGAARRRGWVGLAQARGASGWSVVVASVVEMMIIATIAGGTALMLGSLIGEDAIAAADIRPLLLLGAGSVLAAAAVSAGEVHRLGGVAATGGTARRRAGLGATLALVAGTVSIMAFRSRGLRLEDPWGDPLPALVPVLAPLAVAVAARIALPPLVDRFSRLGLGLGVGRLVGVRRAAHDASAVSVLGLVVTIALTIAGVGLAVDRGLTRGIDDAAWRQIGAPMRIDSGDPQVAIALGNLGSVTLAAQGTMVMRIEGTSGATDVALVNLDVTLHEVLTGTTPAALALPDLVGTDPVPVVASTRIDGRPVGVGDQLAGTGALAGVTMVVVETRDTVLDRTEDWLLIDRPVLGGIMGRQPPVSTLYLDAAADDAVAVAAVAAAAGVELQRRQDLVADTANDPLVRAVRWSYLGAAVVAMAMVVVTTVGLVAVTARSRRRDLAVLGLVGGDRQQAHRAARAELMVPVTAATLTGTALGMVVGRLLDGRLDLSPFAGGFPVPIDPTVSLALTCGVITLATAVAVVAVGVTRTAKVPLGELLRAEEV